MPATGTAALAAEVKPLYDAEYYMQAQGLTYWDQFADLRIQMNGSRGSSYEFPIVENLQPNTAPLDELTEVSTQQMRANSVSVTLQEFGGAIEVTRFVVATSYADVYEQAAYVNGYNMAESVDFVVRAVAGQGSRQFYVNSRTARSQIDGIGVAADRMDASFIELLMVLARGTRVPVFEDGSLATVVHPFVLYDILQDPGVRNMSTFSHPEILFNGEVGYWAGLRLVVSNNAKGFYGAGAANPAGAATPTITAAVSPGDTTLTVSSATNLAVGQWVALQDGSETGNTWYDTNELLRITAIDSTTITFFALDPGPGDAGGLRYAHASGRTLTNANSVYPTILIGPNSLMKAASSQTGPYGETVVTGPFDRLGRFLTFGWYLIAGWARVRNAWLMRGETGSSQS